MHYKELIETMFMVIRVYCHKLGNTLIINWLIRSSNTDNLSLPLHLNPLNNDPNFINEAIHTLITTKCVEMMDISHGENLKQWDDKEKTLRSNILTDRTHKVWYQEVYDMNMK